MATIDRLKQIKLEKLKELREKGIDPYPSTVKREHIIAQARKKDGQTVSIVGRLMSLRGHGRIIFADLCDESGKIQVAFKADLVKKETFALLPLFDIGDFIATQGKVGRTQAGEISVFAEDFQIITKSLRPLPDKWYGFKDVEERYRKRYLDMILNPQVKKVFEIRSKVIDSIREFLNKRRFIEVETPILQPIYGGGFARPFVTHHNVLDKDFYLRISDEMYLKRLIVGGFEKVYEITKVFRNEGIDKDHNPEFTMFEAMIAYEDYYYGMDIIEEIIEHTAKKVLGKTEFEYQGETIDVKRPWRRYKLVEAVQKYTGVDLLSWETVDKAKKAIKKMGLKEERIVELNRIQSVGELIAFAFEEFVEEKLIQPTIIYDYPIEVSPLAKKCDDPRFTQRFEQFIAGSEIGNNYTELNDPIDLKERFIEEKKREKAGFVEAHQTDYDYLVAIEHGFPPTCGIAIGVDRLVMLLTNSKTIKEVITFPTLRPMGPVYQDDGFRGDKETRIKTEEDTKSKQKEGYVFTREQALELLHKNMQNKNLRKHCYAVEAVMRALAKHFGEDEEVWGITGLLHDADYELTKNDPRKHVQMVVSWLKEAGVEEKIINAVFAHGWRFVEGCPEPANKMEWSLYCCDELTGLIVAVALVRPDKRLSSVAVESVLKKWDNKAFAAGVNREQIKMCEEKLGIKLSDFISIALLAMQEISGELGL